MNNKKIKEQSKNNVINDENSSFYERLNTKITINPKTFKSTIRSVVLNEPMFKIKLFEPDPLVYMYLCTEDIYNVNLSYNNQGSYFTFEYKIGFKDKDSGIKREMVVQPLIFVGYDAIHNVYYVDMSSLSINFNDGCFIKARKLIQTDDIERLLLFLKEIQYDDFSVFRLIIGECGIQIFKYEEEMCYLLSDITKMIQDSMDRGNEIN